VWAARGKDFEPFRHASASITGERSLHGGIDIAVRQGTWVGAAADGVVIVASNDVGHYGTAIFIDHENGYVTHYGHLSKMYVHVGQRVKARQLIAKSGATGARLPVPPPFYHQKERRFLKSPKVLSGDKKWHKPVYSAIMVVVPGNNCPIDGRMPDAGHLQF